MTPDVVVVVPMLGRPWTVDPLAESLAASTDRARLLFVVSDRDDDVLYATDDRARIVVPTCGRGDYARKINTAIRATDEPLIFTGACDLHFHAGWVEACERRIDEGAQVVGTNDRCNPRTATGALSTHTMMTRAYAELPCIDGSPGPLFEGYWHEMVDDELVGTAKARGVYAHAPDAIVEHLHPSAGKAEWDDSYRGQQERMAATRPLFRRRRRLWT